MLRATEVKPAGTWEPWAARDCVVLDFDARHRRRLAMHGANGPDTPGTPQNGAESLAAIAWIAGLAVAIARAPAFDLPVAISPRLRKSIRHLSPGFGADSDTPACAGFSRPAPQVPSHCLYRYDFRQP